MTLARRPMSARSDSSASAPAPVPHDDDPPAHGKRLEAARKVRGTDELEHDVHAAGLRELAGLGAGSRPRWDRAFASTRTPAATPSCTAAVPTPPDAPFTRSVSPSASPALVKRASWAVMNASGTAAASRSVRSSGIRATCRSCTATMSASPPPPTSPNTRSPARHVVTASPQAMTVPATSSPRNVGRRAGRGRVAPGALGDVGRVETGVRGAHEHLRRQRHRVGPFADGHHLRAAGTEERHRDHGLA